MTKLTTKTLAAATAALVILMGSVAVFFFGFDPSPTQMKFLYTIGGLLAVMMGLDVAKLPLQRSADDAAVRRAQAEGRPTPVRRGMEPARPEPEAGRVLTLASAQRAAFVQADKQSERGDFDAD